ncbi:hypothetical protein DFH07DRAFT_744203 [Mycena maculata]|uniref:BTB domain-containing protein n=1 Tax=Mycena maculata TaxID=230809 RepID=A0AAD7J020_9AGAR|nr:hypothetical protein DFH07DRAFT_744203 [Mycena maculata]
MPTGSEEPIVSISTTFYPAAQHGTRSPDVVLLSRDSVRFYVHSDLLFQVSETGFHELLLILTSDDAEPSVLDIPEPSPVLNIMLHGIYNIPCAHYSPPFSTLVNAVDAMPRYGINPKSTIFPSTHLFTLLLSQAPLFPLQLYALAAHHDIFDLAEPTSAHLLSFPLPSLSDQMVERMGATLFFLHFGRVEALKRILGTPPRRHPPTPICDFHSNGLGPAWALAAARLSWDARPDMSPYSFETALKPVEAHLSCDLCKDALDDHIKNLISQWATVRAPHTTHLTRRHRMSNESEILVSVSTTFYPANQHRPQPPDVVLLSQDSVGFYVHSDILFRASDNGFRAMLPTFQLDGDGPPIFHIPEPSPVLNIILHAIYDISCAHYSPPFNMLVNAIDTMSIYGITPKSTILPSTHLFALLLSQAPLFPLQLYALAAHHDMFDLAVPISSHLLSFPLSRLSDEVVERIGATLFFLHLGRVEALKRILGTPPRRHPSTPSCDFRSSNGLGPAWAMAIARLAWDARPGTRRLIHSVETALRPPGAHLTCDLCKDTLDIHIESVIAQWSNVKVSPNIYHDPVRRACRGPYDRTPAPKFHLN